MLRTFLCASAILVTSCGGSGTSAPAAAGGAGRGNATPRAVQVTPAIEARIERAIAVTGTLAAEDQVTMAFKVTGRLEQLDVDLGTSVESGQTLASLASTDFQLRVTQADAALQQARARLGLPADGAEERIDIEQTSVVRQARAVLDQARLVRDRAASFAKDGIGSQADLDAAQANLRVAEGRYQDSIEEVHNRQALLVQRRTELELAKQAVTDSRLRAPFAGSVRERHATPGQYLAAGAPVVTIVKINPLRLRLSISERESAAVRLGQAVRVTLEGDSVVHIGRVARISPAIEEASRTLSIEAEVANPSGQLRPGAFANAEVVTDSVGTALLVPASAVVSFAGVDKVFVVADGKAAERRITVGRREADRVEILTGVTAGDRVVVSPGNLVAGDAVTVSTSGGRP
ncbi:MAG: efflux RND transporter periplasmic adaptor subunit [Acidobacteria bacterium]|nr:efflux RND transporter periplasmic adaptor subunit [Acidobacteriota bacterium]